MKTYNEIKELLTQQNLASVCNCNSTSQYNFFLNLVDVNKIEQRVNRLYNKQYALYYIVYDETADEFLLNITFITRSNGQIISDDEINGVAKWIKTADGYVLTENDSYIVTKNKMQNLLPKIYKLVLQTSVGCYMYTYNNAGPGIDECGNTQGITTFYSNCGNIDTYSKPLCDISMECYAYTDAERTAIIPDLYVYNTGSCILTSDSSGLITATCCTGIC